MNDLRNELIESFTDEDYRHGYVDEFLNASIATQIKVLREQRGWSQEELANKSDMKQPRVSVLENVNYSSWNISTLRRIAEAFDLSLCVYFESFGKRIRDIEEFSRKALERQSFHNDPLVKKKEEDSTDVQKRFISNIQKESEFCNIDQNVIFLSEYKKYKPAEKYLNMNLQSEVSAQYKGEPFYGTKSSRPSAIDMAY